MKNQTTKKLLLSLLLCGIGFAAVGLFSLASRSQDKTQTEKPAQQQGYGRAPHLPQDKTQTEKPAQQQGVGRAPHPPLDKTQTEKSAQQGYGRAPHPPQEQIEVQK